MRNSHREVSVVFALALLLVLSRAAALGQSKESSVWDAANRLSVAGVEVKL